MYPYQLSKVLADQRIHDLVNSPQRRGQRGGASAVAADLFAPSSRVSDAVVHLLALLHVRPRPQHPTTRTSTSSAGPMGCVA